MAGSDTLNFNDLMIIGRNEVLNTAPKLTAVTRDGSDAQALVAAGAAIGEEVAGQMTALVSSLFLDSATGVDLSKLVFDRYGVVRKPAAPALGSVSFSTTASNPISFQIPSGTVLASSDGLKFKTVISVTFLANTTGPVIVAIESIVAGSSQKASANTIVSIQGAISGAPSDLVVTNPLATNRGDDEETDDSLRARARNFFPSVRRGTKRAIEQAALGVPGVRTATAIELLDSSGRPNRFVQLIVSDQFTPDLVNQTTLPPTYETQSQQLAAKVYSALSNFRPIGTFIQVIVGQVIIQPIQLQLTFSAGVNVDDVAFRARTAVVNYVNNLAGGQPIEIDGINAALELISGLSITGEEVVSPSGNVVAKAIQVLRVPVELVTAIAVSSSQPLANTSNPDAFIVAS